MSSSDIKNRNNNNRYTTPLDVQERTLRVSNYGRNVNESILRELFLQGGPVKRIVFRDQFSFVEFEDQESVAYCLALFDGIELFGERLQLQPKINQPNLYKYLNDLKQYEQTFAINPIQWWSRFGDSTKTCPKHICSYAVNNYPMNPMMNQMMNPMMNQQMPHPMMYQQMPHQTMATSSSYPNDLDFRNDRRFFRDSNDSSRDQKFRDHRSFNDLNRYDDRNDRNDRNNNERKFRNHHNSNKRSIPISPTRPNKKIRKHPSF